MNRRQFLRVGLGAAAAGALPQLQGCRASFPAGVLPDPEKSGVEHVVVTMLENRSFDHFFGWLPNADARQSGLSYTDTSGAAHATFPLAPDYTGCASDPDHTYVGGRVEYNGGAMDGFLRSGSDLRAIGYYTAADIPFYSQLALRFTALDRYFCSVLGPTTPNRNFLHAAANDIPLGGPFVSRLPTIWDRLLEAGIRARYYIQNGSALNAWPGKYDAITFTFADFVSDLLAGNLPAFSMVEPVFTIKGVGNDDHPPGDIRAGDAFLSTMYRLLTSAKTWRSTVWIVTFDEWGGFFDHVAPPRAAAADSIDSDIVGGKSLLGFRVPVVVASPFTRGRGTNRVSSLTFDHTSILKLVEWRWNLRPLSARDASNDIENLARCLDFGSFDGNAPALPVVPDPDFQGCM